MELDDDGLRQQTDLSMRCYRGFLSAQRIRAKLDSELEGASGLRRDALQALRGEGTPGDPDTLYGSIYDTRPEEETVVDLQHKLLFMMNLLQASDAHPTTQAIAAVERLETSLTTVSNRWSSVQ